MLTRNEGGSCRIRTISSLALSLAVALSCGRLALTDEFVEPLAPEPPLVKFTPRGNSEFIGRQTVGPVTRRFEMYDPHSPEALKTLKEMGFTQVILDWPNLHRDATAIGLDVVLPNWWTDKTKPEEIERGIELAKQVDPARLAGFSVMDEPERNSPETPFSFYTDLYDQMRPRFDREFPGVRLEISHSGPYRSWDQRYYDHFSFLYEAADVMRIMPFPDLNEGPLSDVFFMILRSRELMRIAGRELPLVVILQAWVLPPESKLPEIAELRVMAWQAMLAGVETISFFEYNTDVWSQTPGFHDQFADLMQELIGASNRLRDATIRSRIDAEGVLHAQVSWPNGRTESILVNTNRTNVGNLAPLAVVETSACQSRAPVCPQICAPGPIQQPDCRAFPRPALRSRCVPTRCDD